MEIVIKCYHMKMETAIHVASTQIVMAMVNGKKNNNLKTKTQTEINDFFSLYLLDRTYSLPRTAAGASSHGQRYSHQPYTEGYYTQDRRRNQSRANSHHQSMDDAATTTAMDKPDFYFMHIPVKLFAFTLITIKT